MRAHNSLLSRTVFGVPNVWGTRSIESHRKRATNVLVLWIALLLAFACIGAMIDRGVCIWSMTTMHPSESHCTEHAARALPDLILAVVTSLRQQQARTELKKINVVAILN